mgnify:CR=1 FL=1
MTETLQQSVRFGENPFRSIIDTLRILSTFEEETT